MPPKQASIVFGQENEEESPVRTLLTRNGSQDFEAYSVFSVTGIVHMTIDHC